MVSLMTAKKAPPHYKKTAQPTENLIESEKTYRGIFENCGIPTMVIREDSTILLVNKRFEELSGYFRGEIEAKKHLAEFIDPGNIEKTQKYQTEILKPGGWAPAQYSFGFVDKNGSIRDVTASMTLINERGWSLLLSWI